MRIRLNTLTLQMLINDLLEDEGMSSISGEWLKMYIQDGDFIVNLNRSQVRRLKRKLPIIAIEERYR